MKSRLLFWTLLFGVVLAGCNARKTAETVVEGSRKEPKLVFRLANELKDDSRIWEASNLFRNEIQKASPDGSIAEGEIQVEFFDQGSVGSERQLLESCYFDVLEMVQINSSVVTILDDAYSILDLPYLFVDEEQHREVLYGEIGQIFLDRLSGHNLKGLGFYSTEFRNLFYKTRKADHEVKTPADLRGLKIRVMESPVMINSINAMGATAAPIPFSELFQSMKTGVVDGAENCAKIFVSYKYEETGCNQFTLTEHFANQHILIANAKWFDSLAPKYQKRIMEVIRITQGQFDKIWETTTEESLEEIRSKNVHVNIVEDKMPFILATNHIIEDFRADNQDLASLLDRIVSIRDNSIDNESDEVSE